MTRNNYKIHLFLLLLVISPFRIIGQEKPLEFKDYKPKWVVLLKDTAAVGIDSVPYDPYASVRYLRDQLEWGSDTMFMVFEATTYDGMPYKYFGFFVIKVDLSNGDILSYFHHDFGIETDSIYFGSLPFQLLTGQDNTIKVLGNYKRVYSDDKLRMIVFGLSGSDLSLNNVLRGDPQDEAFISPSPPFTFGARSKFLPQSDSTYYYFRKETSSDSAQTHWIHYLVGYVLDSRGKKLSEKRHRLKSGLLPWSLPINENAMVRAPVVLINSDTLMYISQYYYSKDSSVATLYHFDRAFNVMDSIDLSYALKPDRKLGIVGYPYVDAKYFLVVAECYNPSSGFPKAFYAMVFNHQGKLLETCTLPSFYYKAMVLDKRGRLLFLNGNNQEGAMQFWMSDGQGHLELKRKFYFTSPGYFNPSQMVKLSDGDYLITAKQFVFLDSTDKNLVDSPRRVLFRMSPETLGVLTNTVSPKTNETFRLSPNPVRDMLTLELEAKKNGIIQIGTMEGKVLQRQAIYGQRRVRLDLSGLMSGVYTVTFIPSEGNQKGIVKTFYKR